MLLPKNSQNPLILAGDIVAHVKTLAKGGAKIP